MTKDMIYALVTIVAGAFSAGTAFIINHWWWLFIDVIIVIYGLWMLNKAEAWYNRAHD